MNPQQLLNKISLKYSSSQSYYYSKLITQLVQQKRSSKWTQYNDMEYYVDDEQYLKRTYRKQEYGNKLKIFKEYYFYHQDYPRIFLCDIEIIYGKWTDRKRNFLYKKLKHLFQPDKDDGSITQSQEQVKGVSHFLFQLSQYNPFSKKYYLRTQAKKQKQIQGNRKNNQNLQTKDQISYLKHDLSNMLKQMNDLSIISTLDSTRIQSKSKIYHRKTVTQGQSGSYQFSTNNNSNSIIKLNFKKKANNNHNSNKYLKKLNPIQIITGEDQNIFKSKSKSKQKAHKKQKNRSRNVSPKIAKLSTVEDIHNLNINYGSSSKNNFDFIQNNFNSTKQQRLKSKSINAFTSLGLAGQMSLQNTHKIKVNSKREELKLQFELKIQRNNSKNNNGNANKVHVRINSKDERMRDREKEENIDVVEAMQYNIEKNGLPVRYNSIGKLKPNKLENIEVRSRQVSLRKLKTKPDQFNDKKLSQIAKNVNIKMSSYKSQHLDLKKPSFKIKASIEPISNKKKKLLIKL